ncbi:MAG: hybrid sensor histidine kinase/response regulator transcription factor [Bacteroidales bacterium]
MKKFALLISILLNTICVSSNLNFRTLNVEDGLSENSVYAIIQDNDGFMWFGTKDGLNRYDGKVVKTFKRHAVSNSSLGNNFVRSLCQVSDSSIWVGTDAGVYILNLNSYSFKRVSSETTNGVSITSAINNIVKDSNNQIWIATMTQGLFSFNTKSGELTNHSDSHSNLKTDDTIWALMIDKSGDLWIGSRNGMLLYNQRSREYSHLTNASHDITDREILSITQDQFGQVWAGTWAGGIQLYSKQSLECKKSFFKDSQKSSFISHIRSIYEYSMNELFIGSDDGLFIFDKTDESITRIDNPNSIGGLSDQNVYSIYKDREDGIWIGTYFGGVNYLHPNHKSIENYSKSRFNNLNGKAISQFCEDRERNIIIATEDGGVSYLDLKKNEFRAYNKLFKPTYHNIHALLIADSNILIGTFSRGLDVFDHNTRSNKNYQHDSSDPYSLRDNCIFSLYRTKDGTIYIGTPVGLQSFDIRSGKFHTITELSGNFVYDILEDNSGNLWIATYNNGAFKYNKEEKRWISYGNKNNSNMKDAKLISIFEDSNKKIWFTSQGDGIFKYNQTLDRFDNITKIGKWNIEVTYGILEDDSNNFWISTNSGILSFNSESRNNIRHLSKEDGLQSNQFNFKSILRSSTGKFYFGGVNGFNAFYPDRIRHNKYTPNIKITSFRLLNNSNEDLDSTSLTNLNKNREVTLPHYNSSFSISFVALSYLSPSKNQYRYKLEGIDNKWIDIGNSNEVTYSNLPSGKYTFLVQGCNNDGVWCDKPLMIGITITPPVWLSTTAKVIYLLIIIIIGRIILYIYHRRSKTKQEHEIEIYKNEQEKLATKSKIEFFTTIAHEIRTPLTLINGCLEEVILSKEGSSQTKENLKTIDLNSKQLTSLINQLLDFRKMDSSKYILQDQEIELCNYINSILDRFKSSFNSKGININLTLPHDEIWISADQNVMNKILSNLLSNAIKYAQNNIYINIDRSNGVLYFEVADDGIGISDHYKSDIFKPFFQIKENQLNNSGTGIGLYIVKYLCESMNAQVELFNRENGGACFRISFNQTSLIENPSKTKAIEVIHQSTDEKINTTAQTYPIRQSNTKILVVDDNNDMTNFIFRVLSKEYLVYTASCATEAEELLDKHPIDIIISDIMMPGKDGVELTQTIRSDINYSHIPIILLSAKTDNHTKSEGLSAGANVFIEKPFSPSVLQSQIKSLIENRRKIYESFTNNTFSNNELITKSKPDEEFIENLNRLIEENIADIEFSVESICDHLLLSRSNVQRKIKALTGLTPGDYLRNYRIQKAHKLLLERRLKINEVAFETGFSSASYFTKCFVKHFGFTPSSILQDK